MNAKHSKHHNDDDVNSMQDSEKCVKIVLSIKMLAKVKRKKN